jgi:hypothetical protein
MQAYLGQEINVQAFIAFRAVYLKLLPVCPECGLLCMNACIHSLDSWRSNSSQCCAAQQKTDMDGPQKCATKHSP